MAITDELKRLLGIGTSPLEEEQKEQYVCLRCGEEYPRDRRECSVCSAMFVVERK